METRLNQKVDAYMTLFKDSIRSKASQLGIVEEGKTMQLLQYIYDYDRLSFGKEDFLKRKRVKNFVPLHERCCAKRANDEQCTRRKKADIEYCGTHIKGTPHGTVDAHDTVSPSSFTQKVEVWAQDIQGIIYYIDSNNNVYETAEILMNKINPKIIAKYVKVGEVYSIPVLNI